MEKTKKRKLYPVIFFSFFFCIFGKKNVQLIFEMGNFTGAFLKEIAVGPKIKGTENDYGTVVYHFYMLKAQSPRNIIWVVESSP